MSVLVKGWSIPTDGCCGCYFRTGKYCGILSKNERVLEYAERFTRPDNCPLTELIRCKDCKYRDEENANCTRLRKDWYVQSNSFCSWAEPKETK